MTSSFVGDSFFGLDLKKIKSSLMGFRRSISKRILLLDFDVNSVTFAEAQVQEGAVSFAHVRRLSLPEEALERGVPAEPRKMAGLIKGFCEEADIPAHRAAVVIPHDAAFTTVLSLPSSMTAEAALEYVLDPASAAQVPVQLDQMDADLIPLGLPGKLPDTQSYFLIAIPRKLVDRVVEMLQLADMDLLQLQVGFSSQLQHCAPYLQYLDRRSSVLHLDLLRDCTLASLLIASGPVRLSRLTSIRDFPDPPDADANSPEAPPLNAEAQIIGSESYLPLSDLDLRRLAQEIKQFLHDCEDQYPDLQTTSVVVSGVNSAHPSIDSLLHDLLQLPVQVSRPLATEGVGQFTPDTPLVLQSLGRLIGLGLSFLPSSELRLMNEAEVQPVIVASPVIPEPERAVEDLQRDEQLFLPKPAQELLLTAAEPEEQREELPQDEFVSFEPEPQPLVFSLSEHSDPIAPPQVVVDSEEDISEPQSIFSFSSEQDDADSSLDALDEEELPVELDGTIHLEEDQDEVPFSMQDLLSSFETKAVDAEDECIAEPIASPSDQPEDSEAVHLVDDPALWPSISKLQESHEVEPEEPSDDL